MLWGFILTEGDFTMSTEEKYELNVEWDTCQISKNELESLIQFTRAGEEALECYVNEDGTIDEDGLQNMVDTDDELYEREWDYMTDHLNEVLKEFNPNERRYKVAGHNMGWRNLDGAKTFKADDGTEFINELFPDCEKTFSIFKREGSDILEAKCSHHDSPMGEFYKIKIAEPEVGDTFDAYRDDYHEDRIYVGCLKIEERVETIDDNILVRAEDGEQYVVGDGGDESDFEGYKFIPKE